MRPTGTRRVLAPGKFGPIPTVPPNSRVGSHLATQAPANLARFLLEERFPRLADPALDLGLDHEDVVEIFYNAAITLWLRMSLDL